MLDAATLNLTGPKQPAQRADGLLPPYSLRFFAPDNIAAELTRSEVPGPIATAATGWRTLPERSPLMSAVARALHVQPGLVAGPLAETPRTFLHGDWKMGNLGSHPDGRTILLDWAYPGSGPACWDL